MMIGGAGLVETICLPIRTIDGVQARRPQT
jgi:hypothetical protein